MEKARRTWPTNVIVLGAFTAAQAFLVGTMTAFYSEQTVIIAFAVTAAAVLGLSLFAINTKVGCWVLVSVCVSSVQPPVPLRLWHVLTPAAPCCAQS